jgi:hypothetical protein
VTDNRSLPPPDDPSSGDSLDRRVKGLEHLLNETTACVLALQQILDERGLILSADVTARMAQVKGDAKTRLEFDDSPEMRAWRAERRRRQGQDEPPPDDRPPGPRR